MPVCSECDYIGCNGACREPGRPYTPEEIDLGRRNWEAVQRVIREHEASLPPEVPFTVSGGDERETVITQGDARIVLTHRQACELCAWLECCA